MNVVSFNLLWRIRLILSHACCLLFCSMSYFSFNRNEPASRLHQASCDYIRLEPSPACCMCVFSFLSLLCLCKAKVLIEVVLCTCDECHVFRRKTTLWEFYLIPLPARSLLLSSMPHFLGVYEWCCCTLCGYLHGE
jgi:hypothetical protein